MNEILKSINSEFKLLDDSIRKADKFFNENKSKIKCSYIDAIELHRFGIDITQLKGNTCHI